MNYLRNKDFALQIQSDNLNQIISNDPTILEQAEVVATEEMITYLIQRYDTTKAFPDIMAFDIAKIYNKGDLIELTAPIYASNTNYMLNNLVLGTDKNIYKALQTVMNITPINDGVNWKLISPDQTLFNVSALTSTGNLPDNIAFWTQGDTRYQLLTVYAVDIALYHMHSRISPRNIPQLRIDRYLGAINHLKMIAKGTVSSALPLLAPAQGLRSVYGSDVQLTHYY